MKTTTFNRIKDSGLAWFLIAGLVMLVIGLTAHAQTTQPGATTRPSRGVWYQPVESFDKWKARGISDLIGIETNSGTVTPRQYLDDAQAKGLRVWVQHPLILADPTLAKHPAVAGIINSPDEPDGGGAATAAQMQANYAAIKAIAPGLPVLINFDGNKIPWRPETDYVAYCKAADVVFMDLYPLNFGHGPGSFGDITALLQKLGRLSGGKPLGAFIECSDQRLYEQDWTNGNDATGTPLAPKMRGPTAAEMGDEVKAAVAGGATFIGYFPDVIGVHFEAFDGVGDDVAAAMRSINATLTVQAPAGAVAASSGGSGTPTTQPATAPATKPTTQVAQAQLKRWLVLSRDYNHKRIVLTSVDARGKVTTTLITDPATVAAIDAAAGK